MKAGESYFAFSGAQSPSYQVDLEHRFPYTNGEELGVWRRYILY